MAIATLGGCKFYTKEDLSEYTKRRLKEEYGEEFEIKTVVDGYEASAYPVNNPELLFRTWYVMSNGNGHNTYKQEVVANQYKEIALESFKDFPYEYYINVDVTWKKNLESADQNATIEQYNDLNGTSDVKYEIYISSSALELTNEEILELLNSIANSSKHENCDILLCFVTDNDLTTTKEAYSLYSYPIGSLNSLILDKYKTLGQYKKEKKLLKTIDDIYEWMEEIRNDEVYR